MGSETGRAGLETPKVVIGANDPATLVGMRMALEADGVAVVASVQSLADLVKEAELHAPDVCLVDADLSGGGIRAAAEMANRMPHVPVVLLADDAGDEMFLDAIRVGASGYVPKHIPPARLPNVIRAVLDGEPAIPRALVAHLINQYRARPPRRQLAFGNGRGVDLTSREWQVLELMREGLSTRAIADRLMISEVTVRRHIGSVLKKLQVPTRADALRLLESA
jgi:DNA-binding NarL/FixJ family response regulator